MSSVPEPSAEERTAQFRRDFETLRTEIGKIIVGQEAVVESVLTCLFCGGHCLLEGVPGLGKTLLVRTLAQALDLRFSRIQFTPDLMPADITGTDVVSVDEMGERTFRFQAGPIFGNIILADEINRATPKTQSALLEAMQEHSVTVGRTVHKLDQPFLVMATQNPLEMEGTYPLPEAQLDRFFFKVLVRYPDRGELIEVLQRTTELLQIACEKVMDRATVETYRELVLEVPVAPHVRDYAVRLVLATHPEDEFSVPITNRFVRYGSSPRGAQTLILAAKVKALLAERFNVAFSDIEQVLLPGLRHRLILNFEAEAEGVTADHVLTEVMGAVPREAGGASG